MVWGSFSGDYTVSKGDSSEFDPDAEDTQSTDSTDQGNDSAGQEPDPSANPDAYAPGVGQEPAGGGGGSGGGGGNAAPAPSPPPSGNPSGGFSPG